MLNVAASNQEFGGFYVGPHAGNTVLRNSSLAKTQKIDAEVIQCQALQLKFCEVTENSPGRCYSVHTDFNTICVCLPEAMQCCMESESVVPVQR